MAGPKVGKSGAAPSSCQLIVATVPPIQEVEATGEVVKTVAKAEAERARATRVEENIVVGFLGGV